MKKTAKALPIFLFLLLILPQPVRAATSLIPGGQVIGMELRSDTLTVAAIHETLGENAKNAGLRVGDRLTAVAGQKVSTADEVRTALPSADTPVELTVLRQGKVRKLRVTPMDTPQGKRLGVYLKSGITGIGTVTWYDPESGTFGALGHGVNTQDGQLLSMEKGTVYPAAVLSVRKGASGTPGQLMGSVTDPTPLGNLEQNTSRGVFGKAPLPQTQSLPVAKNDQIHTGPATIRSTVDGKGIREYSVEILKIYPHCDASGRNLLLRVCDPDLLNTTGGIVQGMSGSPICQDGRIVGAVTHVLVNDPTMGYGIFIENMLEAAG